MSTRDRARDRGLRESAALRSRLADELRSARLMAGLGQRHLASATGLSQSKISRTERGLRPQVTIEEAGLMSAALGLRLSLKTYPHGSPVRDAGQLRLIESFRRSIHRSWRVATEVPLQARGDLRAWDVCLNGPAAIGVDAETRLHDLQALQRRLELKLRDSDRDLVILLVAGSRHNRRVVREHRTVLASTLPLETRPIMEALRSGTRPPGSGIVLL